MLSFIILCVLFYILVSFLLIKIKILFGYKLNEYMHVLSYGMKTKREWYRSDKDALNRNKHYKKRLKPL
jgi:hypothetical protein